MNTSVWPLKTSIIRTIPRLLPNTIAAVILLVAFTALLSMPVLAQNAWTGGAGTTNWSSPGNWSFSAVPSTGDTALFDNINPAVATGVVDNIVDTSFTINNLNYQTVSTLGFHTTQLNPGFSLNINGSGGNPIYVGTGTSNNVGVLSVYHRFVGPGTLTVTNPTGAINASQGGDNNDHYATLDLSGLTNFSASVGQIFVGCIPVVATFGLRPMGIMRLADTNFIQTAAGTAQPGILVASYPTGDTNLRGIEQLFLGRYNVISSDAISIGGTKTTGQLLSRPGLTTGFASLRGSAGGSDKVKVFAVGDGRAGMANFNPGGTSVGNSGTFDATGTLLDALVQDLYVARSQTNGAGVTTGVLTFDQGAITADNLFIGFHPSPASGALALNGVGTVNVNGTATLNINNDLLLTRKVGTNIPVATLNIASGATVNVAGNIVTSNGLSTINLLTGGLINMQPAGDGTPGSVSVGTLTGTGIITNAANVTNLVAMTPGTATTPGTLAIASNLTLATNATLNFNLTNAPGAGNDLVSVTGNLNLNGNALAILPLTSSLAAGSYRLIDYTGTRTGFLNFTNPTHYTAALSYPANQVNLDVSGSPATVRWNSSSSTAWDLTTSNWFNTGTSAADRFLQLDNALVDDSGAYTNLLLLTTTLFPNVVTVNSSSRDYLFGGSGKFSGSASLVKQGTSTLTLSNANDFTGPILVSAGTLRTANAAALGATNGDTTIASGATLDIFGSSLFNPGEFITIAGTGLNSTGAVINTGPAQNNGIRYLALSDNASVRTVNRFDIRGPLGSGSFSGALDLRGFTFTKLGPAQMSFADNIVTNAGSIVVAGGVLGLTRSQVDGPGFINVLTNVLLFENSSTGYLAKPISVDNGTIRVTGNAVSLGVPITNNAGLTIDNSVTLTLSNGISGAGALTKSSGGSLLLNGTNTYAGPTTVSAGRIILGTNASIANTPAISLASGTLLDVSAITGFALANGATLSGSGSIVGDLIAPANNTIIPGSSPGTLSFSNSLALNAATNIIELGVDPTQIGGGVNDLISVAGNLTLTGITTLKIAPVGPLSDALPYTVITYGGTLSGALANLRVISDNPRYIFSVVDPALTPGSIQVSVTGNPTTLVWRGGQSANPRAWDGTTSNWLNGAVSDTFFSGDSVLFDNTANTNIVTIVGTEQPGAMIVSNSAAAYAFGGAGSLNGGSLTKQETASLTFTNGGGVSFSSGTALNNGPVTFANGGTNTLGSSFVVNAGPVTFSNNGPDNYPGGMTVNADAVQFSNPAANTFGSGITLNGGTLTFNQPVDVTVAAAVGNVPFAGGTLIKLGANTLTLSGNNNLFDGPILVNAGTLKAANANALGSTISGTTVASGATLDINGTSLYNPGDIITIAGSGLSSTGAVINTGAAQQNALRALTLSGDATIAAWGNRWDIRGPGGSGSLSGQVNLGGFTLTKLGPAIISLVDDLITDPGSIEIAGGTLTLTRSDVEGPGHINVSTNILLFENFSTVGPVLKPIVVSGGIIRLTGNSFALGSPITNLTGMTVDVASGQTLTAQNTISGTGSLTKITAGTLTLTATDNTWGGFTAITAGTLQVGSGGSDGSLPDLPIAVDGTLTFTSLNSFTLTNPITGAGGLSLLVGGSVTLTASNSFNGATLINSVTTTSPSGAALVISNSFALGTTNGNTHIAGNNTGNGRLELVGNISVPEPFLVDCRQAGTINAPAILNVSGSNTLSGPITGSTGGSDMNFQSDNGKLTMAGSFNCVSTAGTRRLKLMGAAFGEWSGVIANSADNLVNTLLAKTGSGTWTLSGSNVYRGNTTISGGSLALAATGSINSSPTIDVQTGSTFDVSAVAGFALANGQTLKGNGTVVGSVGVGPGTLAPGESVGVLTITGPLNLAPGSTEVTEIDKSNGTNDLVNAASIAYSGTLVVNEISGSPLVAGDTFKIFNAASYSGNFLSTTLPALDPGLSWDLTGLSSTGTIKVSGGVSTTPTSLTFQSTANTLDLSWPSDHTGWRLESQTNSIGVGLRSNWVTVPGSTATNHMILNINPANGSVFFRLVYP